MSWKNFVLQRKEYTNTFLTYQINSVFLLGVRSPLGYERSFVYNFYRILIISNVFFVFFTCTGDMYAVRNNFILLGEDLCIFLGMGMILFKFIIYAIKYDSIKVVYDSIVSLSIKNDANHERYPYLKIQEFYATLDCVLMYMFYTMATILFAVFTFFAPEQNSLPFRALLPYRESEVMFAIFYCSQAMGLLFLLGLILCVDNTVGLLWHQIALQFSLLSKEFEDFEPFCRKLIDDGDFEDVANERLRVLIAKHQFIIGLAERMNSITSPMMTAQIFSSNFMICLTGFEATLTFQDRNVFLKFAIHLGAALAQLAYWCVYGNFVEFESMAIATSAFSNLNLNIGNAYVKQMQFVIMRAQKPVRVMANGVHTMNLQTLVSILRGSYSFFTLLRSMNESV